MENMNPSSFFAYGTNVFLKLIKSESGCLYADKICTRPDWSLENEFGLATELYKEHPNWIAEPIKPFTILKQSGNMTHFYAHGLRMKAYTNGSLANIIEQNEINISQPENTSNYEYSEYNTPKNQLPTEATIFYLANAALILDKLHKSNISWRDTKPDNFLLNDKGYLIATDFGISKKTNDQLSHQTDWRNLGRRVARYGFNAHKSDTGEVRNFVNELENGKISNLTDVEKHQLFKSFRWEKLKTQTLATPFENERNKTSERILKYTDAVDYLNM